MKSAAVLTFAFILLLAPAASADNAQDLARAAKTAFDQGQFDRAAELLEAAYVQNPAPALLYNAARAQLQGGHLEAAVSAYKRYLDALPNAPDAASVQHTIDELSARIAREADVRARAERESAEAREAAREADAKRGAEDARSAVGPVPWVIAGFGGATLLAGIPLWLVGSRAHTDAVGEPDAQLAQAKQSTAQDYALATSITLIVGGVLTVAGVVWGLVSRTRSRSAAPALASAFRGEF